MWCTQAEKQHSARQSVHLPLTTYLQDLYAHTLRSHHSGGDNSNRSTLGEAWGAAFFLPQNRQNFQRRYATFPFGFCWNRVDQRWNKKFMNLICGASMDDRKRLYPVWLMMLHLEHVTSEPHLSPVPTCTPVVLTLWTAGFSSLACAVSMFVKFMPHSN